MTPIHRIKTQEISVLIIAITLFIIVSAKPDTNANQQLSTNESALAKQQNDLVNSTASASNQTDGRSMETTRSSGRGRSGRMLDLDHLAGDIGKGEKLAKEQSVSGTRQSRILSEDLPLAVDQKKPDASIEPRSKKSKGKKMSIQGFIPIISLDNGSMKDTKHLESQLENNSDENEESSDDTTVENNNNNDQHQLASSSNLRDQLVANYGGQTSIGHASFGPYPNTDHQQQQQQQQQWQQFTNQPQQQQQQNEQQLEQAGRARKLLGSSNILSGLTANSKRFVSSLVPTTLPYGHSVVGHPTHFHPHHQHPNHNHHQQLQNPMNIPPIQTNLMDQLQSPSSTTDCICVPFFQCKNGFLSESQLSKSQLNQIMSQQLAQSPRSLNQQQQQQTLSSQGDLHYAGQPSSNGQMGQLVSPSQPQDQQVANDIYEQLRKNIESANLEQQLQAYQQQQQQQQQPLLIDERSRSGSNATSSPASAGELEERSLFNRRQSFGPQLSLNNRCGIMRTCCRIPPTMSQLNQRPMPAAGPRFVGGPSALAGHQTSVALGHSPSQLQPQYQMLQPTRQQQQQQPQPMQTPYSTQPAQDPYQIIDQTPNIATSSQLQPAYLPDLTNMQLQQHQQPLTRPQASTSGGFMAGRCGQRQTLGISGRVQNAQAAQLGQENSAEFGEFPAHAAILKRISPGDSLFVCSAVLVSGQWLATAAHCVRKYRPDELKVRLGEWDVNRDDEFYPFVELNVREIRLHADFQPTSLANDIALLRLDSAGLDQQQWPHVAPACLASPDDQLAGQRCWVAGWGKDAFGQQGAFQSVLKKVDLPVVSHHDCELALRYQTKLGKHFRLHANNICAGGERGKDACEGDGGAGLYCLDQPGGLIKAVGLVSWGVGCGQRGVPGVYVNLANFNHWIEGVVAASGEQDIYQLDGRQQQQLSDFKSIISERTINGTLTSSSNATAAAAANSSLTADNF